MTIDEAIKHCEEEAEINELDVEIFSNRRGSKISEECRERASQCRQLAEWLKALKEIWDSGDCNDCRNGQCEWKPELGQLVRYNCPHYVGIANGEVNADEDSD